MAVRTRHLTMLLVVSLMALGLVTAAPTAALLPVGSVALAVDVDRITVGNAPVLSGSASDVAGAPSGGTGVVLYAKPYGAAGYSALTTLTSDSTGRFSTPVRPDRQTSYIAEAEGVKSAAVVIYVSQRMTITSPAAGATIRAPMPFFGDMLPRYSGVAVGVATYDAGRFVVLGQTRTDNLAQFVAGAGLPGGTHTVVVFTSARNGLLKGSRSLRVTVVPQLDAGRAAVYADQIRTAVNAERTSRGLRPLTAQPCLYDMAGEWAVHMAASNRMMHRSDSDLGTRLARCGGSRYGGGGENVAVGYPDGRAVMTGWMNSPGHRANILNSAFTHIGIGVARAADGRFYYAQNFLTLR